MLLETQIAFKQTNLNGYVIKYHKPAQMEVFILGL